MEEENGRTGIDTIGDVPWRTHFCQFYQTKEDVIDILQILFEMMTEGVMLIDSNGQIVQANPAAERIAGLKRSEIEGHSYDSPEWDFLRPDGTRMPPEEMAGPRTMKEKRPIKDMMMGVRHPDGNIRWINVNAMPFIRQSGEVDGVVLTFADMTESRRLEELNRRQREIERLAATGRMAAHIAHEINNPLAGIKNSLLLIKDVVPEDHRYHKYINMIDREIDRIAHIVRQTLDLYRPGQQTPREFPADQVIRDIVALLESDCREHEVTIEVDTGDASIAIAMPEALFQQLLYNILRNAIEASPQGGVIKVGAAVAEDVLTLTVSDQGSGIPEKYHSRIFDPFFTTKTDPTAGGLGLGLSDSKRIVETMGGSIDFESKIGEGTVFHITLPFGGPRGEVQNG